MGVVHFLCVSFLPPVSQGSRHVCQSHSPESWFAPGEIKMRRILSLPLVPGQWGTCEWNLTSHSGGASPTSHLPHLRCGGWLVTFSLSICREGDPVLQCRVSPLWGLVPRSNCAKSLSPGVGQRLPRDKDKGITFWQNILYPGTLRSCDVQVRYLSTRYQATKFFISDWN